MNDASTILWRGMTRAELDVVSPQWIALSGSGGQFTVVSDPQARAIIASAKRPPSILPGVFNFVIARLTARIQAVELYRLPPMRFGTLLAGLLSTSIGWFLQGLSVWALFFTESGYC